MNPLIRAQLKQIQQAVDGLQGVLTRQRDGREKDAEAHEQLLRQYWSRGKELAAMRDTLEEFEEVKTENQRLAATYNELQERLGKVLDCTKTLSGELRQ